MYIELRNPAFEAVVWNGDNFSEMKHFCGNFCTITYETCPIEDYWKLTIHDFISGEDVSVPTGYFVVRFMESHFTMISPDAFEKYFWEISKEEYKEASDSHIEWNDCPIKKKEEFIYKNPTCKENHDDEKSEVMDEAQRKEPVPPVNPIPVGTKVRIKTATHLAYDIKYLYEGQEGEVIHYWKDNKWGQYCVCVGGGYQNCFDRDELEVIKEPEGNTKTEK